MFTPTRIIMRDYTVNYKYKPADLLRFPGEVFAGQKSPDKLEEDYKFVMQLYYDHPDGHNIPRDYMTKAKFVSCHIDKIINPGYWSTETLGGILYRYRSKVLFFRPDEHVPKIETEFSTDLYAFLSCFTTAQLFIIGFDDHW